MTWGKAIIEVIKDIAGMFLAAALLGTILLIGTWIFTHYVGVFLILAIAIILAVAVKSWRLSVPLCLKVT